jgi:peptidoglycan/LPS O-acetylase OafA/YrhL
VIVRRYRTLDAWRAVAALAVVAFHFTNPLVRPEHGWWAVVLLSGWAGVFVFFPISGYCVFAAVCRSNGSGVADFLRRRWRRTVFPYWASLVLCILLAYLASPFNAGQVGYLNLGPAKWATVVSLTQTFGNEPQAINPVYWTLCFEEQFYVVMAVSLLVPMPSRIVLLASLTAVAGLYNSPPWPASWRVPGFFLELWLPFSCGLAAFVWMHRPDRRFWASFIFAVVCASVVINRDWALLLSFGAAIAFILLEPLDDAIGRSPVGAALIALGTMSYSLYLVHVPTGGRVVNLLRRFDLPALLPAIAALPITLGVAWVFYRVVERRFKRPAGAAWPTAIAAAEEFAAT